MAEDFTLKIITPDRIFYEGTVQMVEFNTTEGEIGVLKGHIPMTVIVKPGVLTITTDQGEKLAALHAGFAEILHSNKRKKDSLCVQPGRLQRKKTRNGRKIIFLFTFSGYSAATRTKQRFLCIREIYSKATKQKIGNKTLKKTPC